MRRQNVIEECGARNVERVTRSLIIVENSGEKMLVQCYQQSDHDGDCENYDFFIHHANSTFPLHSIL